MLNLVKIGRFVLHHWFLHLWRGVRELSGDDAYAQYLKHHAAFHANALDVAPALSRKAFFKIWQDSQWKDARRCC